VRRSTLLRFVTLLFGLVLIAAACGDSGDTGGQGSPTGASPTESESEGEGGTITIGSDTANDHGSKDVSGESELSLELDSFYFEPTVLQGMAGQHLSLELENESEDLHNFSIEDQGIDQDVEAGQSATVDVTFPDSGVLVFFCEYHRSQGMVGGLEV
jgi:plastocyanin